MRRATTTFSRLELLGAIRYFILLIALAAPSPASAQLPERAAQARPKEALLFMVPVPENRTADSAYSVELTSHIRDRFGHWHRHEAEYLEFCEATESCGWIATDTTTHQIARSAGADFYVFGTFSRDPAPAVDLLVFETGKRGGFRHKVARISVQAESDLAAQSLAGMVNRVLGDTLGRAIAAARDARDCWSAVAESDYDDGKGEAFGALRRFPNHPSAASCLAYIYGALGDQDSVVWALERAAAGDSSLTQVWGQLGGLYLNRGDTARAVQARLLEVETDPADVQRRMRIVQWLDEVEERETAVRLMRDGVTRFGEDLEFRRILVRMCLQYEMWQCAQENLGALYSLDPGLAGDTAFYFQMIGLAQTTSDPEAAIWWTEEAVKQVDSLVDDAWRKVEEQRRAAERMAEIHLSLRLANAATLADMGHRDSALTTYLNIFESSPHAWTAGLAAARMITNGRALGSGPLTQSDSSALVFADSLLQKAAEVAHDPDILEQVGLIYLDVGTQLVRDRGTANAAADWLGKALVHNPNNTLDARGYAMLALALAYLVEDVDTRLRAEPSCDLVLEEQTLLDSAMAAIAAAGEEYKELTDGLAAGLSEYESLIPQISAAIDCDVTPSRDNRQPRS